MAKFKNVMANINDYKSIGRDKINKEKLANKITKRLAKRKEWKLSKFKDYDISTLGCTIRKLFKMNNIRKQEIVEYEKSPKYKHIKRKNM